MLTLHITGVLMVFYIKIVNSAFFFPSNSAYGIFAAIAVPLDLGPHRNVFVSYNFEANYNLPVNWQLPTYLEFGDTRRMKDQNRKDNQKDPSATDIARVTDKIENQDVVKNVKADNTTDHNVITLETAEDVNVSEITSNHESMPTNVTISQEEKTDSEKDTNRDKRSLLSRRTFYSMLKQRFQTYGYNGRSCLLRLICDTNASGVGEINGFLGSVIHIIFAPSSSKDEQLPNVYYKAEFAGQQSQCERYYKKCPDNILDLISTPVYDIINSLRTK